MSLRALSLLLVSLLFATSTQAQRGRQVKPGKGMGSGSIVETPVVAPSQSLLDFGTVAPASTKQLSFSLINTGQAAGLIQSFQLRLDGAGDGLAWQVDVGGTVLKG